MKLIPIFLPENSCPYHCAFCNVQAANGVNAPVQSPEAIPEQIETALSTLLVHHPGESVEIAFFGGTFTAGDPALMADYLQKCGPFIGKDRIVGIRVSTRPDCVDDEIIAFLKQYGVTTVELGVESFDNNVLRLLKRGHNAETAIHAIRHLQSNGFITGIHLMTGCPEETEKSFRNTVRTTLKIRPDTVRIHPLLVLAGTPLAQDGYQAPDCEEILDRLTMATYCLERTGIPVIRIGLQPTDSLSRPGQVLSGCFHAALRHRVLSCVYRNFFQKIALNRESIITVAQGHLSYAIGFRRENAMTLPHLQIKGAKSLQPWDVQVNGTCYHILTEGLYEIDEDFER
ncbi:MAG: radical SAM protein [Acidobacteria bacterium]|nr:radical SAM protein [Acidobacteriota bacterium]